MTSLLHPFRLKLRNFVYISKSKPANYVHFRSDQQQMSNNDFQRIYESSRSLHTHPIIKFYYFSSLIKMVKEGQVNDVQSCNIITNDTCSIARAGRSNCIETNIQCALCLLMDDWWQWNEQCVNILLKGISETSVRNKDDSKLCFQCCYQQIAQRNQRTYHHKRRLHQSLYLQ